MSEDKNKGTLNTPFMKSGQQAYDEWDVKEPPLEEGQGMGALLDTSDIFWTKNSSRPMMDGYPDLGPTEDSTSSRKTEEHCSPEEMMKELNKR